MVGRIAEHREKWLLTGYQNVETHMAELEMTGDALTAATNKMRQAGQTEAAIANFASAAARVQAGARTLIPSDELVPAPDVPTLEELPEGGVEALNRVAVVKLNGGLATSMGLTQPKSLLTAREGRTFLDIIVGQTLTLRRRHGVRLPLVLMNSDATRAPSTEALAQYKDELPTSGIALDFRQSMVPKLVADTFEPVNWPAQPPLEWCPPGHGDIYSALLGSGMLAALLEHGFRYVMISNADNLGATVDPRIAAHLMSEEIPFLMEVVRGTAADRKGGHIALRKTDDQLVLRETAQTPPEDMDSFRDYRHWRYYNTNSIWVDLQVLHRRLRDHGPLELPVIANHKTVDPRDPGSTPVLQLESAMGAAIGSFPGARLLQVPRTRFVPVKTTDDLALLRSDVYALDDDFNVRPVADREGDLPYVALDKEYFRLLDEFERRMPSGPPSLRAAERFVVHGDVSFGPDVIVRGSVEINAGDSPRRIERTVLDGTTR
jgi:UTP--glucose-1-phosphate uridylyltransferase